MAGSNGNKKDGRSTSTEIGRPRQELDVDTLAKLCQVMCTKADCAYILDMSIDTIRRRLIEMGYGGFEDFRDQNMAMGRASLRKAQYQTAIIDRNPAMQIWLGKQWLGQKDKPEEAEETEALPMTINIEVRDPIDEPRVTRGDE